MINVALMSERVRIQRLDGTECTLRTGCRIYGLEWRGRSYGSFQYLPSYKIHIS